MKKCTIYTFTRFPKISLDFAASWAQVSGMTRPATKRDGWATITTEVPPETLAALDAIAKKAGDRSRASTIREAIEQYIARQAQ